MWSWVRSLGLCVWKRKCLLGEMSPSKLNWLKEEWNTLGSPRKKDIQISHYSLVDLDVLRVIQYLLNDDLTFSYCC